MAVIKLKPDTVEVIDTLFALAEQSSHPEISEEEWQSWVIKVQAALIDWIGYKTFLDI